VFHRAVAQCHVKARGMGAAEVIGAEPIETVRNVVGIIGIAPRIALRGEIISILCIQRIRSPTHAVAVVTHEGSVIIAGRPSAGCRVEINVLLAEQIGMGESVFNVFHRETAVEPDNARNAQLAVGVFQIGIRPGNILAPGESASRGPRIHGDIDLARICRIVVPATRVHRCAKVRRL
jgi:hypothetical protein